ncbi:hypothetical protein GCM10027162_04650 [Streptomyces incanus]
MLGIEPGVEVSVDSFAMLPFMVVGTDRIALIRKRLAELLHNRSAVRLMSPPYEAVPLQEALWWHPLHTHDSTHIWLRRAARRVAAELDGPGAGPRT